MNYIISTTVKLVLSVLALVACLYFFIDGCSKKAIVKQATQVSAIKADSVRYYRDLWNTEHASKEQIQGEKKVLDIFYKQKFDSIAKRLGVKEKQLSELKELYLSASGKVVTKVDSIPVYVGDTGAVQYMQCFNWHDSFTVIDGCVYEGVATLNYNISVPVTVSSIWRRRWFLGRKRYYVDAYSTNPNIKILGMQGIKIE